MLSDEDFEVFLTVLKAVESSDNPAGATENLRGLLGRAGSWSEREMICGAIVRFAIVREFQLRRGRQA